MNTEKFSEAQQQYASGDYRKSARLFLDAVEKGTPVGNGPAYHMAGNSFMRLKRYDDAAVVFEHALRDDTYARRGAVEANLANAYIRTGDFDAAIAHYEAALAAGDKENAYKFYQGTAQAYMQQEKFELAAVAYKHAALDSHNPMPGKTLLNLGLAMMAAGNTQGAVEAYQASLTCPEYQNKGRALLNLGIAYHAQGKWTETIEALEDAKNQTAYVESDLAKSTLADAQHRLSLEQQVAEADQAIETDEAVLDLADDDMVDPIEAFAVDDAGTAAFEQVESLEADEQFDDDQNDFVENQDVQAAALTAATTPRNDAHPKEVQVGNSEDVERFFALSDKEVAKQGKDKMKEERGRFHWIKWVLLVVLLIGGIGGGGAAAYFSGIGFPAADMTVTRLLDSYSEGRSIAEYWTFDAQANIESKMVVVPIPETFTIDNVTSGASRTTVTASIITAGEEMLVFTFSLAREGIGWKVDGIVMEGMDGLSDLATGDNEPALAEDVSEDEGEDDLSLDELEFDDEMLELDDDLDLGDEAPE